MLYNNGDFFFCKTNNENNFPDMMQEKISGSKSRVVEEIFPLAQYSSAQEVYSRAFSRIFISQESCG